MQEQLVKGLEKIRRCRLRKSVGACQIERVPAIDWVCTRTLEADEIADAIHVNVVDGGPEFFAIHISVRPSARSDPRVGARLAILELVEGASGDRDDCRTYSNG